MTPMTLMADSAQCSLMATSVQARPHGHNHCLSSRLYYEPRGRDERSRVQRPSSMLPVAAPAGLKLGFGVRSLVSRGHTL